MHGDAGARIAELDGRPSALSAVRLVNPLALGEAREAGRRLAGYRGRKQRYRPLLGFPVLVKDIIDAAPMPAAAGSAALADLSPAVGAPLVVQVAGGRAVRACDAFRAAG